MAAASAATSAAAIAAWRRQRRRIIWRKKIRLAGRQKIKALAKDVEENQYQRRIIVIDERRLSEGGGGVSMKKMAVGNQPLKTYRDGVSRKSAASAG
jgi:hypothetical protein